MIIQYNTGKAELCFVKVPEGATAFRIVESNLVSTMPKIYSIGSLRERWTRIPKGNWQILGNPFEIDKDQCKAILKDKDGYHLTVELPEPNNRAAYFNARVAMDDWLKHLQIYQTNPYGNLILQDSDAGSDLETEIYPQWKIAEERTGNWILLIKI